MTSQVLTILHGNQKAQKGILSFHRSSLALAGRDYLRLRHGEKEPFAEGEREKPIVHGCRDQAQAALIAAWFQ